MSSTKILQALEVNKSWSIVEAARSFANRQYDQSGVAQTIPKGLQRVDIDIRYIGTDPNDDNKLKPFVRSAERMQKIAAHYELILKSTVFQ